MISATIGFCNRSLSDAINNIWQFFRGIFRLSHNKEDSLTGLERLQASPMYQILENYFTDNSPENTELLEYIEQIMDLNPEKIYFVRCNDEKGSSAIVLQLSEYHLLVLPKVYYLHGKVTETGAVRILDFFNIVKMFSKSFIIPTEGLCLDMDDFHALFQGTIYSSKFKSFQNGKYWHKHFLDYQHRWHSTEYYKRHYGIGFVEAQQVVLQTVRNI
ncbi:hypothetical protein SAMN04515674_1074 [Pseudarcicella hirudinis]|uniref:Uncharacterized protein n=3 Tax=Pseudarcicella hirudinis TaxID=1079859 RepID=A0A1I5U5G4_9BACT|nr:hypothetical protein SAMN04515674_1074 [Pseudarcicella hirudinis]